MKHTLILLLFAGLTASGVAQQDLQSSSYFLNPLPYNPAYAGSRGTLNVHVLNRVQWLGWAGAPRSQVLAINAPFFRNRLGIGASVSADRTGARGTTSSMLHAAYHFQLNDDGLRLSLGLNGGRISHRYDFSDMRAEDPDDPSYLVNYKGHASNFGAGAYLLSDNWYAGLSMPHLMRRSLGEEGVAGPVLQRHVYMSGGYVWELTSVLSVKATSLLKMTANAPATLDLLVTFWAFDQVGLGLMYRLNESLGFHASYRLNEQFQVVYAFDFPVNQLKLGNFGTHEFALLYDVRRRQDAYKNPRYF